MPRSIPFLFLLVSLSMPGLALGQGTTTDPPTTGGPPPPDLGQDGTVIEEERTDGMGPANVEPGAGVQSNQPRNNSREVRGGRNVDGQPEPHERQGRGGSRGNPDASGPRGPTQQGGNPGSEAPPSGAVNTDTADADETSTEDSSGGLPSAALWLLAACIIPWALLEAMFFVKNRNVSVAIDDDLGVVTKKPAPEESAESAPEESAEPEPEESAEPEPEESAEPEPEESAEPEPEASTGGEEASTVLIPDAVEESTGEPEAAESTESEKEES